MKNRNLLTLLTLSLAICLVGCAEPPTAGVDAANARLDAVANDANTYAADAYRSAEAAATALDAELDTQAASFVLFRSYERALELIGSVETAVDAVENAIEAEKSRLRTETERLVGDTEGAVTTARASIAAIPTNDLEEEQATTWDEDLATVESSLAETARLLAGEQLIGARAEAESALASANAINRAVTTLVAELEQAREEEAARRARGDVTIPSTVLADGQELSAGTYQLNLAADGPTTNTAAPRGRWVEFLDGETVAGRGLAVVIPDGDIGEVSESGTLRNEAQVVVLKERDYVRVWLNRDGTNYLVHLPPANSRN